MTDASRRPLVVYSGPVPSFAVVQRVLAAGYDTRRVEPTPDSVLPAFYECDAFLDASMKVELRAEDIDKATRLRLISTATTGATHIDADALAARGVELMTLKGQKALLGGLTPAAEHSWALVMACARKLPAAVSSVAAGQWDRVLFPGMMLKGRTIGLVGMGRIGGWMARYADAFGMNVIYHDPHAESAPSFATAVDLDTLASGADIISIHVHATPETRGMIDRRVVSRFRQGSIFVNTSRGEITDEVALVDALEKGVLGAVGVDVLTGEPEIEDNVLWRYAQRHDNVIITPHIGGFCPDAVDIVTEFAAQRIAEFFRS